jgi:hypothetical protein
LAENSANCDGARHPAPQDSPLCFRGIEKISNEIKGLKNRLGVRPVGTALDMHQESRGTMGPPFLLQGDTDDPALSGPDAD